MSVQFYRPHALADGKHELSVDGDILKMHLQRNKQYIKNITWESYVYKQSNSHNVWTEVTNDKRRPVLVNQ